jgi:hypothetical protein
MKTVLIAIPHRGSIHVQLANYLLHEVTQSKNTVSVHFEGRNDLCRSRNAIVTEFLKSGMDFLFMLDADVIPPVGAVDLMVAKDLPLLAGVYFRFGDNDEQDFVPVVMRAKPTEDGMVAERAGTGCMMAKREVFTTMEEKGKIPWFTHIYNRLGDGFELSEDLHFCEMAKECGYKIHVETRVLCSHWKPLDVVRWLQKQELNKRRGNDGIHQD